LRYGVNEDPVDTADELAVFEIAVDKLEFAAFPDNVGVLAGDAAVVEHNVVLFCPADRVRSAGFEAELPDMPRWVRYFQDRAHRVNQL
jgi:hypothetical protein